MIPGNITLIQQTYQFNKEMIELAWRNRILTDARASQMAEENYTNAHLALVKMDIKPSKIPAILQ